VLAGEHRFAAGLNVALASKLAEQDQRLVDNSILGEIQVEPSPICDQPLTALGIGVEESAKVSAGDLGVVALER